MSAYDFPRLHGVQVAMQYVALALIGGLAAIVLGWTLAAALGLAPWLDLDAAIGPLAAGPALQVGLVVLLAGLCFFLPANVRVLRLERSHRSFRMTMEDVARAYQAVHAADRNGVFGLKSEFDSVRDRLIWLRDHPDLGSLEPEVMDLAAQMSHESRELADIYSVERVARARKFLEERQYEAEQMQERLQMATSTTHELKRWLEKVDIEESMARAQLARLKADLTEIAPELGLQLTEERADEPKILPIHRTAAE